MPAYDEAKLEASLTSMRSMFRAYGQVKEIQDSIKPLMRRNNAKTEGPINMLIGPTRTGKSHLLADLTAPYAPVPKGISKPNGDFADHVQVLSIRVRKGSTKSIAEAIYHAMVGEKASKILGQGHVLNDLYVEIGRVAAECGTRLLILDEAHESIQRRGDVVAEDVAVFIKDLSNLAVFSILVVGTKELDRLNKADGEFQSRVTRIHRMKPFTWNEGDLKVWVRLLTDVEDKLVKEVFGVRSGLTDRDMAYALMIAAQGAVGNMSTLIEVAGMDVVRAMVSGKREKAGLDAKILWSDLEYAFAAWGPGAGRQNPFSASNRPSPDGLPPFGSLPDFEPGEDDGNGTGVRERTRRNARDSRLRK